ncbi:MAG TPA: ATP-binding protein [Thermoanaerobaculia bacterium]|nr:ATP-binding protein [Thermoanaerobaculia bacterium]
MKVSRGTHHRRFALALLVAGLPCLLLLALAGRLIQQERELAATRERQHREALVLDLGNRLAARLERIRLQVSAGVAAVPALELIAHRDGDSLQLPWEAGSSAFLWPASEAVRAAIAAGEREELAERAPARAIAHYRSAMAAATAPGEKAYARLLLARALHASGREPDALREYRAIAGLGPGVTDNQQIPIALYAVERLAALEGPSESLQSVLETFADSIELSPAALHLVADLVEGTSTLRERIDERIRRTEQAARLQRDIGRVLPREDEPRAWIPYGEPLWLVGATQVSGRNAVIAVSVEKLVRTMVAEDATLQGFDLVAGRDGGGESLGSAFPGLRAVLPQLRTSADEEAVARRHFLIAALAAVLATSLIAAWLLLRDVRREVRLADLRSQFVSSVSHELKTPLSAIRMFAESLRMGRATEPQQRDEYLEIIVNESERLSRLLENVLEFSKIERGDRHYKLEWGDLAEVVRAAVRAVQYPLQQMGFRLELEIAQDLSPVRIDADAVEQAVLNLLANAMKYSGTSREIGLRLEQSAGQAILRVIDSGLGIPLNEQEKIFEKFYRARNSDGVSGAGLGLALVAHIAKAHDGRVTVQSEPGRGSTFSMFFPLETS